MNACIRLLLATHLAPMGAAAAAELQVDFGYAPAEWQTLLCWPDDPHKALVDHTGALLYHPGRRGGDFGTRIWLEVADHGRWRKQELHSPFVPIVRTLRSAEGLEIAEDAFAVAGPNAPNGEILLLAARRTSISMGLLKVAAHRWRIRM